MNIDNIIQVILAAITVIGIFCAWCSSNKQLKISNKQTLFEKRLKVFLLAKSFESLLVENKSILEIPTELATDNSLQFTYMTNSSQLYHLSEVIPKPLDLNGPCSTDLPEAQRDFLLKKEELLQVAKSAEFVFQEPENQIISAFLTDYIVLLDSRRRYDVFIKTGNKELRKNSIRFSNPNLTDEDYFEYYLHESKERDELLTNPINKLSDSFKKYQKIQKKLKTQISLIN